MNQWTRQLRHSLRRLAKSPGFTFAAAALATAVPARRALRVEPAVALPDE